jgi:hypothetical protein
MGLVRGKILPNLAPGWAMVGGFGGPFLENLYRNTPIFFGFSGVMGLGLLSCGEKMRQIDWELGEI